MQRWWWWGFGMQTTLITYIKYVTLTRFYPCLSRLPLARRPPRRAIGIRVHWRCPRNSHTHLAVFISNRPQWTSSDGCSCIAQGVIDEDTRPSTAVTDN